MSRRRRRIPAGRPGASRDRRQPSPVPSARRAPADVAGLPVLPPGTDACVWMSAGLVAYKLCDSDFACERCSLDAALRGAPTNPSVPADPSRPARTGWWFPRDRRYDRRHTWIKPVGEGRVRLGLDAFGAELVGPIAAIGELRRERMLPAGAVGCTLRARFGALALKLPVSGRVEQANAAIRADPGLLERAPYEEGWLLELRVPHFDPYADEDDLLQAEAAQALARHDVRRFRRMVGMALLVDSAASRELGAVMADGGEPITDLRRIAGAESYRRVVTQLLGS